MQRLLFLAFFGITGLAAADLPPGTTEAVEASFEAQVRSTLKAWIFAAEVQVVGGGYQDLNSNKVGEYMFLAQLAGRAATSKMPLNGTDTGIHMLTGPLATSLDAYGYHFVVVLPAGDQGLLIETDPLPAVPMAGVVDREKFFACIAWPTGEGHGKQCYSILPDGIVRNFAFDGKPPEIAKAISYDPRKGTWSSPWQPYRH